jgi:four helix bundle protein
MGKAARSFEDLEVYQLARKLTNAIYEASRSTSFAKDYGLRDQIRRAAVSVMSNIAEGFERNSNADLINYLHIAKGSCGEVRAQLTVALDQRYISEKAHAELEDLTLHISAMLRKLIEHVKTSAYRGMRYETEKNVKS